MANVRWIEDDTYDPKFDVWTRANVGEVLPEPPSPAAWDLLFGPHHRPGWRDCMVNRLGIGEDEISEDKAEIIAVVDDDGVLIGNLDPRHIMEEMGRVESLIDDFERETFM